MDQNKIRKIHLIYGWATAALVLYTAFLMISGIVGIYESGERAFSRASIVAAFQAIALPCWTCLIAVIGGGVLHLALPLEIKKASPLRDDKILLSRYRINADQLPQEALQEAIALQKKTTQYKIFFWISVAALSTFPLQHFSLVSNFGVADITTDVIRAVLTVMIPGIMVFMIAWLWTRAEAVSVRKEIELYKSNGIKPAKVEKMVKKFNLTPVRCILAAVAVLFIVLGVLNEGHVDVLGKAIKICTECIGLG